MGVLNFILLLLFVIVPFSLIRNLSFHRDKYTFIIFMGYVTIILYVDFKLNILNYKKTIS